MYSNLKIWLRVIRFRFLAASAIAVTTGLVLSYWDQPNGFNVFFAFMTYLGIFCLHSSVDLLNDYWDYKRGIDLITKKTRFSGGTGVLPEGLLKPQEVYRAGILFLAFGLLIGVYFVFIKGYVVGLILGFATLSIVLYSTKLVNLGLGELFVGIKGALIVIGSFYVQTGNIILGSVIAGIVIGMLSSLVLFINSIPDVRPDKEKGRKTLAIILENYTVSKTLTFVSCFFIFIYLLTAVFYFSGINNILLIIPSLFLIPLGITILVDFNAYLRQNKGEIGYSSYEKIMEKTVLFSRLYGLSIVMGMLILCIGKYINK
jgi:1,4-dihydroxy-2-naphthoate octaprenyltransferase